MSSSSPFPRRPGNFSEKLKRMCAEQPLIPIGALTTVGFLLAGLRSLKAGNKAQSQLMMRGRVAAQGLTVVAIYFGIQAVNKTASVEEPARDNSHQ